MGPTGTDTALHTHEDLGASIVEAISDGCFFIDREWIIRDLNSSGERIMSLNRSAVVGRSLWDVFPDAVDSVFFETYTTAMKTGIAVRLDGPYGGRHYEVHVVPSSHGLRIFFNDITARMETLHQLKAEKERFQAMIDSIPHMVWIANGAGEVVMNNARHAEYTGYTDEEMRAWAWKEIVHADDRDNLSAVWAEALRTRNPYNTEARLRRSDGEFRWHLVRARPKYLPDGSVETWFGTNTDIEQNRRDEQQLRLAKEAAEREAAERRKSEAALAETKSRLEAVMNAMPVGIAFSEGLDAARITTNVTMQAQFDSPEHHDLSASAEDPNAYGRSIEYAVKGRKLAAEELPLQRALVEQQIVSYQDVEITLPSGDVWYADIEGAPIRSESGEAMGAVAVTVDVTERKRAQDRIRLISETASQLLATSNAHDCVPDVLAKVSQVLGFEVHCNYLVIDGENKIRLNSIGGLFPEQLESIDSIRELDFGQFICGSVAAGRQAVVCKIPENSTDPSHLVMQAVGLRSFCCHPLISKGQLIGTLGFGSREKTSIEDVEVEVMRIVADQVAVAFERTSAQLSLELAKEAAEAASRMKTTFLASMSHELRTPLGAILGFAELLRDPSLAACDRDGFLDIVTRNGKLLHGIIDDILDLTKVEAGFLSVDQQPVDLETTVLDVAALLRVQAEQKGIDLVAKPLVSSDSTIVSDPIRIKQILMNLLGNAIKFTERGKVEIALEISTEAGGAVAALTISDTGVGMTAEQTTRLFQPFVQADDSVTRKFGGTGLGLALSKRIARALGGDVKLLESREGLGSVFRFELPITRAATNATVRTIPAKPSDCPSELSLNGLSVLLVDDSADNRNLVQRLLGRRGAKAELATDGEEAVRLALEGTHDLVLMDISMPVMDGYTATRKLRESGFAKPILALTAHALPEIRKRCLDAGFTDHFTKPIAARELLTRIEELTRATRESSQAPPA